MNISDAELEAFGKAYAGKPDEDPHDKFGELLGIPRDDAKLLCYKILWSSPFLNTWKRNIPAYRG